MDDCFKNFIGFTYFFGFFQPIFGFDWVNFSFYFKLSKDNQIK